LTIVKAAYYYYFSVPTCTKPQAKILELNKVNGCNDISFGAVMLGLGLRPQNVGLGLEGCGLGLGLEALALTTS